MRMMSADLKRAQHCWEASPAKASICVNSVSNWYASLGSRAIVFVLTHLTHIAYAYIAHYSKKSNFVYKFNFEHIWNFAPKIWILVINNFGQKMEIWNSIAYIFKHFNSFFYSTPHLGCDWIWRLQWQNWTMAQNRFPMHLEWFSPKSWWRSGILDCTRTHSVWWLERKEMLLLQQGESVDALDQHGNCKRIRLCFTDQPQPNTHHRWLGWK